jgi:hypothetical protein
LQASLAGVEAVTGGLRENQGLMLMSVSQVLKSSGCSNSVRPSAFFRLFLSFSLGTAFGAGLVLMSFVNVADFGSELTGRIFANEVASRFALEDAVSALQGREYAKALGIAESLANDGDAQAQVLLARMHAKGEGMPSNYPAAYHWYKKAAEQGDPEAQFALAELYA